MVANILPTDTPWTQGMGSKGQTIYFSESSHVAYQIKADDAGSNMVANILPTDTPLTQGMGSKGQTISFTESSHFFFFVFVFVFVALRPKSTAMVIAGRSVHLTTLFPGQA